MVGPDSNGNDFTWETEALQARHFSRHFNASRLPKAQRTNKLAMTMMRLCPAGVVVVLIGYRPSSQRAVHISHTLSVPSALEKAGVQPFTTFV